MSYRSSKGFSLVETLVASALVAMWAVSSQQLLQIGLTAIERAERKAQAVEALNSYIQDAHIAWRSGSPPAPEAKVNGFLINSIINLIDENNASVDTEVTWGEDNSYSLQIWLSR
ncbi:type II secretion system protein [uncultured Idiomarina sp.]|uniref:PulJ/GspJ family protein n=1 Tax=uncultured Idiomarina sp. TaxID=352961 RepID=UPI00259563A0|nr:type II secretion system protein [uncultured Idiomarina sp.]